MFFPGGFTGLNGGGGAPISSSAPHSQRGGNVRGQSAAAPLQHQLYHIGEPVAMTTGYTPRIHTFFRWPRSSCDPAFQPAPSTTARPRVPGRPPPPCCSTAAPETRGSCWPSTDTCVGSRTPTETRQSQAMQCLWTAVRISEAEFVLGFFFSHSPLHLAIIHQQTAVVQQLIQTLLSSQQQGILNTANHLLQVEPPNLVLTSAEGARG